MAKTRKRAGRSVPDGVEKSTFLRFIDKVTSLWKIYLVIFAVVVAAGGVFVVWYYIDQNTQNKAAKELAKAQKELQDEAEKALAEDPDNIDEEALINSAVERYGEVVEKYPRTSSGKLARFRIASGQFQLGEYDESIANYDKLTNEKSIIGALSEIGLGDCYRAKKELESSEKHYKKARDRCKKKEFPYIPATMALAGLYMDEDELDEAEELYREVVDYYLYSPLSADAADGLMEIEIRRELSSESE